MSSLLGVPIDRYLRVDMDDFTRMVDAVGGIDVEVETRVYGPPRAPEPVSGTNAPDRPPKRSASAARARTRTTGGRPGSSR